MKGNKPNSESFFNDCVTYDRLLKDLESDSKGILGQVVSICSFLVTRKSALSFEDVKF
jgi:hypothetical protein